MSQPKRYDDQGVWKCLYFEGSTNGWVKWDDYAALAAENERLKERVAFLEAADRFKIWNEKTGEWETRFSISTNGKPPQ